jgi:hypothetical protein
MEKLEEKSENLGLCFDEIQNVLSEDALNSMEMNNLYGGASDIKKKDTFCDKCNDCSVCNRCTKCNDPSCDSASTY